MLPKAPMKSPVILRFFPKERSFCEEGKGVPTINTKRKKRRGRFEKQTKQQNQKIK
jgi:hypothetical protein